MTVITASAAVVVIAAFATAMPAMAADVNGGVGAPATEAALFADVATARPGQPFTVALRLKPEAGWHTYWRNPGDSGMATVIDWQLPPGFRSGPILWPAPERFSEGTLTSYGYGGEVVLLTEILPPATAAATGETVTLTARAEWLICRDICIPQGAEWTLALAVAAEALPVADPAVADRIARARGALPQAVGWPARYGEDGGQLRLTIDSGGQFPADLRGVWFYPYDGLAISHGAPQAARLQNGVLTVELTAAGGGAPLPQSLAGVLTIDTPARRRAVEITARREPSG
jgi:thiol:disulfide interchange protein DsbD